ncbi:MAG: DUF177 domain-containing protein [Candidatus Omnitrophica bacterium]|nr:DUF177 domain-containing protein [Candidatus Omnitrophota bacterium]
MRIVVNQIPQEGLNLFEDIQAEELDLGTDMLSFEKPIKVSASVSRITNTLSAQLDISGYMICTCSRCLIEFERPFYKHIRLTYQLETLTQVIDLNDDIRQEIILDCPQNPICNEFCKGLCFKCGKNLNDGPCECSYNKRA